MKKTCMSLCLLAFTANYAAAQDRITEVERKIEILAQEMERLRLGEAAGEPEYKSRKGLGPAASKVYGIKKGVSVAGYGEFLYENFKSKKDDGSTGGKSPQLDALRAILYFGYKWNDRVLFNSEIEFEHASTGKSGEVSVEFAYVDYQFRDYANLRSGMMLMPVGLVNELHEPVAFHGAKRPDTESRIIPTTWRKNGIGLFGDIGPVSYRTYLVNGLDASGFTSSGIRGARQKGSQAKIRNLAWVGRADVSPVPGLELGSSIFAGTAGQGISDTQGIFSVPTTLWEAHGTFRHRGLEVKGLFAHTWIGDVARLNNKLGFGANASVGERQFGYYLEAAYDVLSHQGSDMSFTPFYRFENVDTNSRVPVGFAPDPAKNETIHTVGVGFKPFLNLVFKADYQNRITKARTGLDQFNLGMGYLF